MPLYEYACDQCHRRIEKIQSFSAPPLTVCPHCGGHLERTISAPAVQFKGSGWYVSDYARPASKPSEARKEGASDISASAESTTPSTETPAAKKESAPAAAAGASSSTSSDKS